MLEKMLIRLFRYSIKWWKAVFVIMGLLTILSASIIPFLEITSSQKDLISQDHPEQIKYTKFIKEFGSVDNLVVVLEGDFKDLKLSADSLAQEYAREKEWIKSVFYRIDTSVYMDKAPLFLSVPELKQGLKKIRKNNDLINRISGSGDLVSMLDIFTENKNKESLAGINPDSVPAIVGGITGFFDEWEKWIKDSQKKEISIPEEFFAKKPEAGMMIKGNGYLFSRDFKMLFLFVQPLSSNDHADYLKKFMGVMRKAAGRVFQKNPELKGKVKVAYTGIPAHVLTEDETVFSDVNKSTLISIFLVALILYLGFRSVRKVIIAVIPVLVGMVISLGIITLILGRLNLISSSFFAVLFGIGIDFAIYFIRRTEEELGNGHGNEKSVRIAVSKSGRGICTGGLTTGLAFFVLMFSEFKGYSELGLTAGLGVLVVLISTLVLLPALLHVWKIEPRYYDLESTLAASAKPKWMIREEFVLGVFFLLGVLSIYSFFNIDFDYNALHLLPQDAESTEYQLKMEEKSDFKMSSVAVTAPDFQNLRKKVNKIKSFSEVSRVESLTEMIPDRQNEKIRLLADEGLYFRKFSIKNKNTKTDASEYIRTIDKLIVSFEKFQDMAFSGGKSEIVDSLDKLIEKLESVKKNFSENKKTALLRTREFEKEIFSGLEKIVSVVRTWDRLKPVTEASFSEELVGRFKSKSGEYAAFVYPAGSMWDIDFLDKFIMKLKTVTENITGYPVTHRVYVRLAVDGVIYPILYSLFVVVLILAFDFRKIHIVLLALVPLALGTLLLQGALYLTGMTYNIANIAGLPLILGLGVVYGVHIVHRWLENPGITAFAATKTTGRGVSFAALTTMSGLFSIVFARHGGVSSMGFILLYSILLCLITALFFLPALIDFIYMRK